MTQLTLPGFEAPNLVLAHRLFFAVVPDPGTAGRIARVAQGLRVDLNIDATLLSTERLHVTLHHLGDYAHMPEVTVARACAAAASLVVPPFDVTFDQVFSFKGRPDHRPFVLAGSAGLDRLADFQHGLGDVLRRAGLRVARARFTPHLTLLYDAGKFEPRAIEPITWTVREFMLIHSWLGKTRYDVKGRWTLKS